MAKFEVGPGFFANFNTSGLGGADGGIVTVASPFMIRVEYDFATETYLGNFQYHGDDLPTGTVKSYRLTEFGDVRFALTQANIDVTKYLQLSIEGNGAAIFNLIFNRNDTFIGAELDDKMSGFGGNDVMLGRDGRDNLNGGAGNDTITGGSGNDRLTGGPGNDKFMFGPRFGKDVITDFVEGKGIGDVLSFSKSIFQSFAAMKSHAKVEAGHVVITDDAANKVILNTVQKVSDLHANDFLFA